MDLTRRNARRGWICRTDLVKTSRLRRLGVPPSDRVLSQTFALNLPVAPFGSINRDHHPRPRALCVAYADGLDYRGGGHLALAERWIRCIALSSNPIPAHDSVRPGGETPCDASVEREIRAQSGLVLQCKSVGRVFPGNVSVQKFPGQPQYPVFVGS